MRIVGCFFLMVSLFVQSFVGLLPRVDHKDEAEEKKETLSCLNKADHGPSKPICV